MKEITDSIYTVEEYFALAEESDQKLEFHWKIPISFCKNSRAIEPSFPINVIFVE